MPAGYWPACRLESTAQLVNVDFVARHVQEEDIADQEFCARLWVKQLSAHAALEADDVDAGLPIVTLAEGEISELHVGLKGTMNALTLKDIAEKTHRGMSGRVEAGSLCYGYKVVKQFDARGERIRGDRAIDAREAETVRRIFRMFAAGVAPRTIARTPNVDGISGPGGKPWGDTTIRGHVKRGTGIVNNEPYIGRLAWNRLRYVKDPSTGKRVSRLNPETDWIIKDVPKLRIVDDELRQAARTRQDEIAETFAKVTQVCVSITDRTASTAPDGQNCSCQA